MSDLQCPATLVLVVPGAGDQAQTLAGALRHRQVAAVYTSGSPDAVTTRTRRSVAGNGWRAIS